MILTQALQEAAKNPGQTAFLDANTKISFKDFRDSVGRLSNLYQSELEFGGRVAILARNSPSFALTFFAMSNTGNPVLLLDPKESDESLAMDMRQLSVKTLLVSNDLLARARELCRREGLTFPVIEIEKRRGGEYDPAYRAPPERPLKDTDPVLFLRASEDGGKRFYCSFHHKQILASCQALKRVYRLTGNDRLLTTMHWSHPFALTHGMLLPLFSSATCAVDPQSTSIDEFIEHIAEKRITHFAGPKQFYFQLLSYCATRKYTLPGVKGITIGLGTLSLALRKTYKLLQIPVVRCYGRAEAVWSIAMDDFAEAKDIEHARMHALPGVRLAVLNAAGEEIPGPGRREGSLVVMSDSVAAGYWHPQADTAKIKSADSFRGTWLKTGEVARLEGEGDELRVAVLGQASDMLCLEGEYLSPKRIDAAALKIDGVAEAAGFVRLQKNKAPAFAVAVTSTKKLSEREVLAKICEELPGEYHPQSVHFVDAIPKDAFDSIHRSALQRQLSLL